MPQQKMPPVVASQLVENLVRTAPGLGEVKEEKILKSIAAIFPGTVPEQDIPKFGNEDTLIDWCIRVNQSVQNMQAAHISNFREANAASMARRYHISKAIQYGLTTFPGGKIKDTLCQALGLSEASYYGLRDLCLCFSLEDLYVFGLHGGTIDQIRRLALVGDATIRRQELERYIETTKNILDASALEKANKHLSAAMSIAQLPVDAGIGAAAAPKETVKVDDIPGALLVGKDMISGLVKKIKPLSKIDVAKVSDALTATDISGSKNFSDPVDMVKDMVGASAKDLLAMVSESICTLREIEVALESMLIAGGYVETSEDAASAVVNPPIDPQATKAPQVPLDSRNAHPDLPLDVPADEAGGEDNAAVIIDALAGEPVDKSDEDFEEFDDDGADGDAGENPGDDGDDGDFVHGRENEDGFGADDLATAMRRPPRSPR